jgi:peroxiredoxin Q/BCP
MPLRPGDRAPEFTLRDQHGRERSLAGLRGRPVVLYFYPRDNTPACTAEACTFRDEFQGFRGLDAEIVGVSADSPESHAAFAKAHALPFTLLSDPDDRVRTLFAVPRTLGLFPGRTTYVIDAGGVVRHVFTSQLQAKRHIAEALAALRALRAPAPQAPPQVQPR